MYVIADLEWIDSKMLSANLIEIAETRLKTMLLGFSGLWHTLITP